MRKPGIVAHICNCRTTEAEKKVSVSSSQSELHHEVYTKLGYKKQNPVSIKQDETVRDDRIITWESLCELHDT